MVLIPRGRGGPSLCGSPLRLRMTVSVALLLGPVREQEQYSLRLTLKDLTGSSMPSICGYERSDRSKDRRSVLQIRLGTRERLGARQSLGLLVSSPEHCDNLLRICVSKAGSIMFVPWYANAETITRV